jgi:hypothetical protein
MIFGVNDLAIDLLSLGLGLLFRNWCRSTRLFGLGGLLDPTGPVSFYLYFSTGHVWCVRLAIISLD